ncbi:hypothetical protein [Pseudosulfitobacter koreensis]|uniref:Major Facilitator Superfamily protein n=1 Tax=Pseudosulfitobacter koreensis TaxID=2968472 RepID=A0ABT1Z0A0_9RHOB|nr:hypothetical protein [Pseudosulfitobacter koreense]MCR8826537.1 hypothetical protein [Pseudosulfitobacter koreense]
MRHVFLYISGLLFFHAVPPLIAARPLLSQLPLAPHLLMYLTAALMAVVTLRAQWVLSLRVLLSCLLVTLAAPFLIGSDTQAVVIAGFLMIGIAVPVFIRFAFEDAVMRDKPIGSMLGYASFALETIAFGIGALITYLSVIKAQGLLFIVPLVTLFIVLRSRGTLPVPTHTAPRLRILATVKDVIPAVCANTAFFLFLAGVSLSGDQISPMQVGSAIAITAFGFAGGAFLSDHVRRLMSDKLLLVVFSLCGLAGGLLGALVSLESFPGLILLIAIAISTSNGVIISTSLSTSRLNDDAVAGLPADNALVFLAASGGVALVFSLAATQFLASNAWMPIVLVYLAAIGAALVQKK